MLSPEEKITEAFHATALVNHEVAAAAALLIRPFPRNSQRVYVSPDDVCSIIADALAHLQSAREQMNRAQSNGWPTEADYADAARPTD